MRERERDGEGCVFRCSKNRDDGKFGDYLENKKREKIFSTK